CSGSPFPRRRSRSLPPSAAHLMEWKVPLLPAREPGRSAPLRPSSPSAWPPMNLSGNFDDRAQAWPVAAGDFDSSARIRFVAEKSELSAGEVKITDVRPEVARGPVAPRNYPSVQPRTLSPSPPSPQ